MLQKPAGCLRTIVNCSAAFNCHTDNAPGSIYLKGFMKYSVFICLAKWAYNQNEITPVKKHFHCKDWNDKRQTVPNHDISHCKWRQSTRRSSATFKWSVTDIFWWKQQQFPAFLTFQHRNVNLLRLSLSLRTNTSKKNCLLAHPHRLQAYFSFFYSNFPLVQGLRFA